MGLAEGDVIEIVGKRTTAARAIRPYAEDEGIDIIRLDGLQRANAGVGSGDFVEVRKATSKPATRVVFAPAQPMSGCRAPPRRSSAASTGGRSPRATSVATAGHQRVNADMPDHIRQMLNAPAFALQEIRLIVVSTAPKGIVHIDEKTEVELLPEYTEPRRRAARRRHLRRSRRHARHDRRAARDGRAAAAPPRAVPAPRRRSAQGRAAARPARDRQDAARARGRQRKRRPNSSTSPGPRSWARPMARASGGCARSSSRRRRPRPRSSSSTKSIRSRPSAARSPARRKSGWSPSC